MTADDIDEMNRCHGLHKLTRMLICPGDKCWCGRCHCARCQRERQATNQPEFGEETADK